MQQRPAKGQPLRVLFVDTVPRLSGAEQSLADLTEGCRDVGVEPIVCLPGEGPLAGRLRAGGVLVRTLRMDEALLTVSRQTLARKPWIALARLWAFLVVGWRLRKLIREVSPRVIHSNTLKAHLLCLLPALVTRTPLVWHVRDILPKSWISKIFIRLARLASVVIVPSRAVAEPFRARKKVFRKVRLVPNGIRVADFVDARGDRSLREMIGAKKKDPVIGIVGRIAPWKGQEVFLRAAAMLAQRHPKARFAIIGTVLFPENDAPFDAYLHRLVLDLGIADQVAFLGHQPAPEAMAACDIVVHASMEPEPFGRVIVEAMAAGKPVVAAAGGATAEILPPAAGFIVPPARPELLADAIDRLLADPELREHMGETGADVAASFFGIERVVLSVAQIHRALAARATRRRRGRWQKTINRWLRRVPKVTVPKPGKRKQAPKGQMGWYRDGAGNWAAPTDAFAGPSTQAEVAPTAWAEPVEQVEQEWAEEPEYEIEYVDEDDETEYEAEADYDGDDDGDEEYDEAEEVDEPAPTGPVAWPDSPRAPEAPKAPSPDLDRVPSVAILDLTDEVPAQTRVHAPIRPKRPSPASVSGGQQPVVSQIAGQTAYAASAYANPYPAPAADVRTAPFPHARPHLFYDLGKRILDTVVSALVLLLGSPLWIAIAIMIKLESRGPVFHRGIVYGRDCKPFTYYKFRSMRVDSNDETHRQFIERYVLENGGHLEGEEVVYKLTGDSRVTSIGRFIRRFSLDEIPQLFNVLKGQMSLVGPRPPLDYEFALYDEAAKQRLTVLPGISGLQQVWARNMASFEDKLRMDMNYIRERTLWMDIKLLLWTIPASFRGH
jgi:lipopolysaccharide/colanic/teichoic acid biosynthesis glycosyltransferase/glycosyltransferase involved in cell wall biosynthesis